MDQTYQPTVIIRRAKPDDYEAIGTLHAASWRLTYRGILADAYLDNDLAGERKRYWEDKLRALKENEFAFIAGRGGEAVGFIAILDKPEAGYDALIDNLHVRPDQKGLGTGSILMNAAAAELQCTGRKSVYLWVLKGNTAAEDFYKARGGQPLDSGTVDFGGKVVEQTRFVWDTLDGLLRV